MNHRVIYSDITPVDIKNIGLTAVKVFITGFQPLYFGNNPRLSLNRLQLVPLSLGYKRRSTEISNFNVVPPSLP